MISNHNLLIMMYLEERKNGGLCRDRTCDNLIKHLYPLPYGSIHFITATKATKATNFLVSFYCLLTISIFSLFAKITACLMKSYIFVLDTVLVFLNRIQPLPIFKPVRKRPSGSIFSVFPQYKLT